MSASIDDIGKCAYCNGVLATIQMDTVAAWVQCGICFARGPAIAKSRPDWRVQVVAAWNAGRKFGRIAIAKVPGNLPSFVVSSAERLRLIAENMFEGQYGAADAFVLIVRAEGSATVVPHNISSFDVIRTLDVVRESTRVRATHPLPKK